MRRRPAPPTGEREPGGSGGRNGHGCVDGPRRGDDLPFGRNVDGPIPERSRGGEEGGRNPHPDGGRWRRREDRGTRTDLNSGWGEHSRHPPTRTNTCPEK